MNARIVAGVLTVVAVVIGAALVANVEGYTIPPLARFWMTISLPGITMAVSLLPPIKRRRLPRI